MPADEYAPVVRGALKLKGSTPSGIKKKKKKPKISDTEASSSKKSALQSALEEEDAEGQPEEAVERIRLQLVPRLLLPLVIPFFGDSNS